MVQVEIFLINTISFKRSQFFLQQVEHGKQYRITGVIPNIKEKGYETMMMEIECLYSRYQACCPLPSHILD